MDLDFQEMDPRRPTARASKAQGEVEKQAYMRQMDGIRRPKISAPVILILLYPREAPCKIRGIHAFRALRSPTCRQYDLQNIDAVDIFLRLAFVNGL